MKYLMRFYHSAFFTFLLFLGILITGSFGAMGYWNEIERQNKLNRPFANFALRDPRAAFRMMDEQILREMNERQRLEYYALYWKQKAEELKTKAKLSFVRGGL